MSTIRILNISDDATRTALQKSLEAYATANPNTGVKPDLELTVEKSTITGHYQNIRAARVIEFRVVTIDGESVTAAPRKSVRAVQRNIERRRGRKGGGKSSKPLPPIFGLPGSGGRTSTTQPAPDKVAPVRAQRKPGQRSASPPPAPKKKAAPKKRGK